MTGRVKVIKRRAVSTGQLRRRPEGNPGLSVEQAEGGFTPEPAVSRAVGPATGHQLQPSEPQGQEPPDQEPPDQDRGCPATVEVVSVGPESSELRVRCACGSETVIALNHPAEGGAM